MRYFYCINELSYLGYAVAGYGCQVTSSHLLSAGIVLDIYRLMLVFLLARKSVKIGKEAGWIETLKNWNDACETLVSIQSKYFISARNSLFTPLSIPPVFFPHYEQLQLSGI